MKNRKMKKLMSGLLATAMALTMTMGISTTTMAAPLGGAEAAPADAYFAKTLHIPDGVTAPVAGDFVFSWAKKDLDGGTSAADLGAMPALTNITLDPITDGTARAVTGGTAYDVSSPNIVAGITFAQPGVYTYTLTEDTSYSGTLPATDIINYSLASYDVMIQVALDTTSGNTYVQNIVVDGTVADGGGAGSGKITLDPDNTTPSTNAFKFNNGYNQTGGGVTPGGNTGVLEVSKTVTNIPTTGLPAGVASTFGFDVVLTKAISEIGNPTYTYQVYDAVSATLGTAQTITFAAGATTATVSETLKNGDYILFTDLPVGTAYNTTENGGVAVASYNTSYNVTDTTGTTAITAMTTGSQNIVDTGAHGAACTNRYYEATTPTGILLNNLPFIMMIVVVFGAAAALFVARRRKALH